jgi:hypothetical protein
MLTRDEATKHDAIFYYEWLASMEDKKVGIGMDILNYGTK